MEAMDRGLTPLEEWEQEKALKELEAVHRVAQKHGLTVRNAEQYKILLKKAAELDSIKFFAEPGNEPKPRQNWYKIGFFISLTANVAYTILYMVAR